MRVTATLTEAEVAELAKGVFDRLQDNAIRPEIVVRSIDDFDGDPSLRVLAIYSDDRNPIGGAHNIDAQLELSDLLVARGDLRPVYLSTLTRSDFQELLTFEAEGPPDVA